MSNKNNLHESGAAGTVSAHSVAVRADAGGSHPHGIKKRAGLLDFLSSYQSKKLGNRLDMKQVKTPFNISINEDVSLDQIYSKMSGIENAGRKDEENSVTYGVEDDDGNLMKITVKADQGEDFEVALAQELGEVEAYKMTGRGGYGRDVSMAEVLFNLKQKFDIIDVEFPEIPKDKVYNADKVSDPSDLDTDFDMGGEDPEDESMGLEDEGEMGGEDTPDMEGGDDMEGGEDDLDFDPEGEDEEDDLDTDIGDELGDEEPDEETILKQIVRMMSADAEAKKAQHEAEAEKYRAMQAEYTMKAAKQEMHKQEDLLKMEEEQEKQKKKEQEAKKLADLAKYKLRGSVSESASFLALLSELNDLEDETSLRMQRRNIRDIEDPREKALQTQIINNKRRILQRRRSMEQQNQSRDDEDRDDGDRDNQMQPRRNEPVPDRRPIGGSNT